MNSLKRPEEYINHLLKIWKHNEYMIDIDMYIYKHTNIDHLSDWRWGWFFIFPLDITVGYWEEYGRVDITDEELKEWNEHSKVICRDIREKYLSLMDKFND